MKKNLLVLLCLSLTVFFVGCDSSRDNHPKGYPVEQLPEPKKDRTKKSYSGMKEAMEMEFQMTKEVKTGIVPSARLVNAVTRDLQERRAGRLSRLSALSWAERGPTTNVVGPGNGNTRGPFGPQVTSGRTRAIWVDLADATKKTVWLGAVSGGIWKTNDITISPANWILIDDFLGNLAVTSICQDPTNTNTMYFGTGEKTINVDAVRGGGIWKSTDHGVTWNLLPNTTGFFNVSRVLCDAAGNLYVATIGSNGIQRSTDGGATWTNILPTGLTNRVTEMRISSTGRMHIICGYRNVGTSGYRFTDNPATVTSASWTQPDQPTLPFPTEYNCELAVAGNTLYVLPSNASDLTPTIYKSGDGGANWAATTTSPPGTAAEPTINAGQGWYDLAIGVDPANPDVVIAGGLNFYRSENGGGSWSQITRWVGTAINYVHADHHAVVWNGAQVLLGTDGGIFYSSDNGSNFFDRNIGLRTKQFYSCAIHPTLANYFLGGTQDNGTHQFSNAGLSGSVEVLGGDGGFVHIDENEPQFQFGSTTRSNYRRSINGGTSWSSVNFSNSIGQFINPTDYDDVNNRMYTSGGTSSAGNYIRWNDPQSGSNFSTISIAGATTSGITSVKVSNYTNNRVFFGSSQARVVRVDNAHLGFPTVVNITGSNMPGSGNTVSSINSGTSDDHLIATFSNYGVAHVFVTNSGGGAGGWTNISGNLPDIPVRWAMFYPEDNDKAIVATEMGIFETDDINGASTVWTRNADFPVVKTNMLQYRYSDRTLLAATHGRGMWTTTIPSTTPFIRYASSYAFSTGAEATTGSGNVCRNYKDYTIPMRIDQAPTGTATATVSVSGGTAVQGIDYDISTNGNFVTPSNVLTFNNGSTAEQTITVRVYNDAEVETAESFTLTYAVTGTTNAVAAPSSLSYTFNIADNDQAPTVSLYGGNFSIGTFQTNLSDQSPFRSNLPKFRIQYLYTLTELANAGLAGEGFISAMTLNVITKNSTQPFNGFTISMGNTTATTLATGFTGGLLTQVYTGNYSTVSGANTFNFATPFYWDGISNVLVNICFDNGASVAADADVVEGVTAPLGTNTRASTYSSATTGSPCSFAAALISDTRPVTSFKAASGNPIATAAATTRTEYVKSNGTYNFYSGFDVISRLSAASGDFGCVTSRVAEAGNVWQSSFAGPRSQKLIGIDYTGTAANSSYTLGIYFTAAELGGKDPNLVRLAGTSAATIAGANSGNTNVYNTTVTNFGTGYVFTANVFGPGLYFLAEAAVTSIRNPSRQENFVKLLQNPVGNNIQLSISNQSRVNLEATLFTNNGQLVQRWNLGRADGNRQLPINEKSVPDGLYILRIDGGDKTQSFKLIKQ
jgi:hypothetical protein